MVIKIKELNIQKDALEKVKFGGSWTVAGSTKLDGKIKVELSEGIVTGSSEVDVFEISEKLRNKLYEVLSEIENELNGVKVYTDAYSWDSVVSGGVINASSKTNAGGITVKAHNGETVLTSDEVGNMHVKGNVQLSDAKVKQPEETKEWKPLTSSYKEETKSHNTDKDESEQLADMLFKASKVLGTTVISGDTTVVDAKKITEAIRKMMESEDFKLL